MRRYLHIVALAILAISIACNISDSTGPLLPERALPRSVVIPPTSNTPCNVHWATATNGSWFDPAKWSPAGVPGASSSVCIDATGTYTVTLDAPVDSIPTPVLAISIGGAGATPSLNLSGDHERISVTEGVAIASGATLLFNSGQGNTLTAQGTITNAGSLKLAAPCGGCGGATISANIINTGTLQISGGPTLTLSKVNGAYQNTGNITLGGFIDIPATAGNPVFSQEGGLYFGTGNFETLTMRAGTFQLKGGKIRTRANPNPVVVLDGASLVIDSTATDSVTIGVRGRTDAVPTITGNVPALTTLWIAGASTAGMGTVALVGNPTNYGKMIVTPRIDVYGAITVSGTGRLTNVGTINNTDANRDSLIYSIDLTNNGTINAIGQSSIVLLKPGGSYQNSGLIDLQAGISRLVIRSNATFSNTSPATITNGAVEIIGSQFIGTGTLGTTLNVHDGGSVAPGFPVGLLTAQQLNVASTGIVNIDLGGNTPVNQYDRAVATSLAGFSGTLNLTEVNGFKSGLCGQVFDVLYAPSGAAGMFPVINGLNPAPGRILRPILVSQTSTTPAIVRLVGFDPNLKVCAGPDSVGVDEGGATLQYSVALRDAPTSTVIVKAVGDAQVSAPDSAVFTTSNWQTPQILHVSAVDDTVYEGTHVGHVTHTVRSLDAAYNGVAAGSITATITDNDLPPLVPTTVAVTIDSSFIEAGHTAQATAVVRDQNGNIMSGETVTWSSNTPSFASVSASGVVTGISAGSAVIKATDGSASGTDSVTVTAPPPPPPVVTTISVSIDSSSLQIGHTAQATATVRDQYGAVMSGQSVTWSSNTPSFATVSSVGVVTAVAEGSAVIKATVGSVFGTGSVNITSPPPPPPIVTTISVAIDSSSLQVGHTAQATATVRDQYGQAMNGQTITWSSDTPLIAGVSNTGLVSAVAEGNATIRATVASVSGTAPLTITPPPPASPVVTTVTVSVDSSSLQVGHTAQATAVARDQNGAVMDGQSITWSTNTPSIVGISSSGVVTGLAAGTADIRATAGSVAGNTSLVIGAVTPVSPYVGTVTVTLDSAALHVGKTAQATAIVRDSFGDVVNIGVIWRSLSPSIISVSSSGVVTALKAGSGTIEARVDGCFQDACLIGSGVTNPPGTATVAVVAYRAPQPRRIEIGLPPMSQGDTATATAIVYDQYGAIMPNQPVVWSVETPQVLTISNRSCGASSCVLAKAIGTGWARVSASLGSLSARNQVYVSSGFAKPFTGSVSRSQQYTITFYSGCSWNVWVENITMSSDWRINGYGFATGTLRAEGCQISPWSATVYFPFSTLSATGTTTLDRGGNLYAAKFQMEKVSRTGMTGYLIFQFFNFGNRAFDIPVKISLQ